MLDQGVLDRPVVLAQPRLRGLLHAVAFPLALVAGMALITFGPTLTARLAAAVYVLTSALLFGVSAAFHLGRWSPRVSLLLRRSDHANIYLVTAGTYMPFVLLSMEGKVRILVLCLVWGGATAGIAVRVLWTGVPRWTCVGLYLALGWTAVLFLPYLLYGAGLTATLLVVAGGVLYSAGGIVYGLQRPDPSPGWFGFHEIFHAFTIAAYALHYAAVSLVVYAAP
ncbi:MAG: hemolysin III family protein [Streptosporangiaceae bacterium]